MIQMIVVGEENKAFHRCPYCGRATIELRKTAQPPYRCTKCTGTFEVAEVVTIRKDVTTYRSHHEVAWVDLIGELTSDRLRRLCTHPKSQLSIRQLDYARFQEAVRAAPGRTVPVTCRGRFGNNPQRRPHHSGRTCPTRAGRLPQPPAGEVRRHLRVHGARPARRP